MQPVLISDATTDRKAFLIEFEKMKNMYIFCYFLNLLQ